MIFKKGTSENKGYFINKQGWRTHLDASHIAETNISKDVSIFGVFDGHGG